ncbi:hypothetical protein I204_06509 [Kwoniella mangroviensis CBS 8886]|uniref:uncharacterized protein n=1 Tax=Kwoniella mangroviensis CBS 8507 TaxID=1296122 RepID=UPI00080D7EDC|nr:uncharacterized protein I203_03517 [Kwoniella mangroviensis CBS 8507]OCF66836.1 hypothetical protein I203_03517 [Kwoniella mangroviensis CBS 8507]OCF73278.1 hypothetical protein I204_06509 [Kwoniella mangroviensis CBS 8886]
MSKPSSNRSSVSSSPTRTSPAEETTTLLPPTSQHPHAHPHTPAHPHARKTSISTRSVSGRSVAGSVRNYGAVAGRPGPVEQVPRVSKLGQRRILTTFPLQATFFILTLLTFASFVLSLILLSNAVLDFSVKFLPYRGSGFAEFWISLIGSWIGLGGVLFFSHPSYLFFLTTLITLILHIPILFLALLSPSLKRSHAPLILVPLLLTGSTLIFTLLSNFLVRRAKKQESLRISRMLTEAAGRERASEEGTARALVGVQRKGFWGRILGFFGGVFGLIAGLAGLVLVSLLLIDLSISAYDGTLPLPSPSSQLVKVQPASSQWPINIHLACTSSNSSLPTIVYTSSSGVPGSLALLPSPLPPANEGSENPGRWLFDLQEQGKVGRVCTWDRPGYGFSDVLSNADLGGIADSLWEALSNAGMVRESKKEGLIMVGEGYGGLVSRVFASRHPSSIHSFLHLDAQTASTYFHDPSTTQFLSRLSSRLFPSLLTPLSLNRLPSVLLRRSTSLSRILASSRPTPSTVRLNEKLRKSRLQETIGSQSRTSASFRVLLESGYKYPSTKPAIVLSSDRRMKDDESWAEGQRVLAEEVTSDDGLVDWIKVDKVDHFVCENDGRQFCEDSIVKLLKQ